jgi:hypothetical protein
VHGRFAVAYGVGGGFLFAGGHGVSQVSVAGGGETIECGRALRQGGDVAGRQFDFVIIRLFLPIVNKISHVWVVFILRAGGALHLI